MDIFEIAGFRTGQDQGGVNFLDPADAFEKLENGYVFRQVLQSREGFRRFSKSRLPSTVAPALDNTRVMGIFENVNPASSAKELLVFDKNFLYKYNEATNLFTKVPFTANIPITSFGISNDEDYVSGTPYFTKAGAQRFVFTSKGMTDIYFYDGSGVKRFTDNTAVVGDNLDYSPPPAGPLTRADKVIWFNGRLNFFSPQINAVLLPQTVLYSGIRDSTGNGDKFDVVGSGELSADTYEIMKGAIILGDIIIMTFQQSNWALEKTTDVFNPYFVRKIPSVLGTDATFSAVSWAYEVKSLGRTGMVTTDGRRSLRFDDKVPFLTEDDINPTNFELTYGGFNRSTDQFMFAYRDNLSDLASVTQDKVLVYNYKESTFSINDERFSVFGEATVGTALTWSQIDETQQESWLRWDTTEDNWRKIGVSAGVYKSLAGDNLGFVYELNSGFDDYFASISAITNAASAVLTVSESGFLVGDEVILENVVGLLDGAGNSVVNGIPTTITAATTTSITIDIDTVDATAYTSGGSISKVIDFKGELTTFNPYRDIGRKVYVSHVEVYLNTDSGGIYVDCFMDEQQAPFKTTFLEPNTNLTQPFQWITLSVNNESNFMTLVFRRSGVNSQVRITSTRIHCSRGSFTAS